MKTCSRCGKQLPTGIDEFGDIRQPVCINCFFDTKEEEQKETDEINELEEALEEIEDEISDLESQHFSIELKIKALRAKGKPTTNNKIQDRAKLMAWQSGQPIKVSREEPL